MKRLVVFLIVAATLTLLLNLVGCEGVSGPRGTTGDKGDPGSPWVAGVPDNRFFALAVCNGLLADHNGASKLYLSFDEQHTNAGDTVVCQRLEEGQVPEIDGVDEGAIGWGEKYTVVELSRAAGFNNFIDSALVRSAYDGDYVYFQVKWSEVANEAHGFTAAESDEGPTWVRRDTTGLRAWRVFEIEEDHLLMMFEVNRVEEFDHDGCFITCHSAGLNDSWHRTNLPRERMDYWTWSAARGKYSGFADDGFMDNSPVLATFWDNGIPAWQWNLRSQRVNDTLYDLPEYQHISDPNANHAYPLWDWEITAFNRVDPNWQTWSTIPAVIMHTPTGSNADVQARGGFADGAWTVELKRARYTGNGDDAQF